jgi:hypothetical protein
MAPARGKFRPTMYEYQQWSFQGPGGKIECRVPVGLDLMLRDGGLHLYRSTSDRQTTKKLLLQTYQGIVCDTKTEIGGIFAIQ